MTNRMKLSVDDLKAAIRTTVQTIAEHAYRGEFHMPTTPSFWNGRRFDTVRFAPYYRQGKVIQWMVDANKHDYCRYTIDSLARGIGQTKANGQATTLFRRAFAELEAEEALDELMEQQPQNAPLTLIAEFFDAGMKHLREQYRTQPEMVDQLKQKFIDPLFWIAEEKLSVDNIASTTNDEGGTRITN